MVVYAICPETRVVELSVRESLRDVLKLRGKYVSCPLNTKGDTVRQAQLTFAMARHALIDLSHIFSTVLHEDSDQAERLSPEALHKLCRVLVETRIDLCGDDNSSRRLTELRAMYEPQAVALCEYLQLSMPHWTTDSPAETSNWKAVQGLTRGPNNDIGEHVSTLATANIQDADHG